MSTADRLALAALDALGRRGARRRRLASRLDVIRVTGPRHALHRLNHDAGRAEIAPGARDAVYRRIWTAAAAALDAELTELPGGYIELRRGAARTRVIRQAVPLDDAVSMRLALQKVTVHRLLEQADVPVPAYVDVDYHETSRALAFLAAAPAGCVVKAADGTGGGEGTTCGVRTPEEFLRARLRAGRRGDGLLVEQQAPGDVYRLLFLEGALLDVVRQVSPTLDGDGRSTIDALIRAENRRRAVSRGAAGVAALRVDLDCLMTLSRAGLGLDSVLAPGERRTIKTVTNEGRVEDCRTARGVLCDEIVAEARRAVRAVGLRLAGVDVITPDPSRPLRATGGVVGEINSIPALHRHYQVADAERAMPVAEPILARLLEPAAGGTGALSALSEPPATARAAARWRAR
jgi:cyanophycin synthetase